ncbi:MAG: carbonic anhydrase family protein [Rickettsiales bacterium]
MNKNTNTIIFIIILLLQFTLPNNVFAQQKTHKWTYDDDYTGQDEWGNMEGYETCKEGAKQSPIKINDTTVKNMPEISLNYKKAEGILKIDKQSFIVTVSNGGSLEYDNNSYKLKTIEIHSPSGHHIKGRFYPVEIHLIHQDINYKKIAISILANIGKENPALDILLENVESISDTPKKISIDVESLLSGINKNSYYRYEGSLPYPPCSENVTWLIPKTTITISNEQLGKLVKYTGRNTRLPQPVYIRKILETP